MANPHDQILMLEKRRDVALGSWLWLTKRRDDQQFEPAELNADIEAAWYRVVALDSQIEAAKADADAKVIKLDQTRPKT